MKIRINDIFVSIDGEINNFHQGRLTTFVRFSGCNVRCSYCDTLYALSLKSGKEMSIEEIISKVDKFGIDKVTITGGEPLLQEEGLIKLLLELKIKGYKISVETNGTLPITKSLLVLADSWIVDWKGPSSGVDNKVTLFAFDKLRGCDWVKYVISNKKDYQDALYSIKKLLSLNEFRGNFAFSPVFSENNKPNKKLTSQKLIKWMIKDRLNYVILNVQIHKLLGVA